MMKHWHTNFLTQTHLSTFAATNTVPFCFFSYLPYIFQVNTYPTFPVFFPFQLFTTSTWRLSCFSNSVSCLNFTTDGQCGHRVKWLVGDTRDEWWSSKASTVFHLFLDWEIGYSIFFSNSRCLYIVVAIGFCVFWKVLFFFRIFYVSALKYMALSR